MDFKKAEMIELHNSNVIIHKDNYSDGVIGWADFPGENEEFYIQGDSLATLCKLIGVNVTPFREDRHLVKMEDLDFPITRRKMVVGSEHDKPGTHKIVDLAVKIESSDLIHIRFVTQWEENTGKVNYTQEVTYSGSYTVWWPCSSLNEKEVPV